jgi:putative spermidine/putrescine transport system permease protein
VTAVATLPVEEGASRRPPRRQWFAPRQLLAIIPLGFYLIFLVAPVYQLVEVSLHKNVISGPRPFTSAAYSKVIHSAYYRNAWYVSLRLAVITSVVTVVIAVALSLLLARAPRRVRAYLMLLLITPILVSGVVRDYGWLAIGAPNAPFDRVMQLFGGKSKDVLFHPAGVVLALTNVLLPLALLSIYGRVSEISPSLYRAAASVGSSPVRTFRTVTLPLLAGAIWNTGALLFCLSIAAYDVPQIIGGGRVNTIAQAIFEEENVAYDQQTASALGVTLVIVVFAVLLLVGVIPALVRAGLRLSGRRRAERSA